jgi:hypothetical protein
MFPKFKVNKLPIFKPRSFHRSVGEAEGGVGMFFGGVSRVELLKSIFYPVKQVTGGVALTPLGFHTGALIDGAGDYCQIEGFVPPNYVEAARSYLRLVYVPLTAGNNAYNIRLDIDYCLPGSAYNTLTANKVFLTGAATQNLYYLDDIYQTWAGLTDFAPWDMIGLRVTYQGAGGGGVATNLHVLGAQLMWP